MTDPLLVSIDTNILLRHVLQDHEDHSPRASRLMLAVRRGEQHIFCPATVIFESIHLLHGRLKIPRASLRDAFEDFADLNAFHLENDLVVREGLRFWADQPTLDFADCYHLALTKSLGLDSIYTFDKKMDRYPGITRLEP